MGESSSGTSQEPKRNCWNLMELPDELTASILSRLGVIDILESAQKVCMKWRQTFKDPLMWRTIDMCNDGFLEELPYNLEIMCDHAVDRSRGGLVDINIEYFSTDKLLSYITHSSSGIRRLRLACCDGVSDWGLSSVALKLGQLEELEITLCEISYKSIAVLGSSCPLLKSFKFNKEWFKHWDEDDDDYFEFEDELLNRVDDDADAFTIAETMPGLHHLQLFGNMMTNDGLRKILDCCPHLESLDLRHCFNLKLKGDLAIRCTEGIKNLFLPLDSTKGYAFGFRYDRFCSRWIELPDNVTALILSRLGVIDILENAQKVCLKWRRICRDPLMWRTIDMCTNVEPWVSFDLEEMCHYAIDRSCGDLKDINIKSFGTDETLQYIANRSSKIRRLRIVCNGISDEGLIRLASKLPLLEDLEISLCHLSRRSLEVIGCSCPLLKSLKLNHKWRKIFPNDYFVFNTRDEFAINKDSDANAIAGTMHGSHFLQIVGNQLSNDGLTKILGCCPHLESLDMCYCFNLDLQGDLGRMCAERIKKLLLPNDSIVGYEFNPSTDRRGSYNRDNRDESCVRPIWEPHDDLYDSDDDIDDDDDFPYYGSYNRGGSYAGREWDPYFDYDDFPDY